MTLFKNEGAKVKSHASRGEEEGVGTFVTCVIAVGVENGQIWVTSYE